MISTNNGDYHSLFKIKEATRLTAEPTFKSLTNLQDQLKINAQAIPSVLGGGNHGHLGLVVSPAEYQMITLTPFVRPINPGEFVLTQQMNNLAVDQIEFLRQQHNARLALYNQVEQVESALKQFITDSVPQEYLLALRHNVTKKLTGSVSNIMRQLFNTYGNITAQLFMEKQNVLNNHVYDTTKPIDTVFNLAKDYQDYAAAFGNPQPQGTIITTCYNIFRKTGRFNSALQKWNEKPDADKTWDNFKTHFWQIAQLLHQASITPSQNTPIQIPMLKQQSINPFTVTLPRVEKKNLQKQTNQPPRVQPLRVHLSPVSPPHHLHYGSTNCKLQALHFLQHQLQYQPKAFHIYNKITGKKETIDTLRNGSESEKWNRAISNEFGRLATGNKFGVESTDTIEFIAKHDVPDGRKITYGSYRFDYRPLKSDPNRFCLVAGGDKLEYESDPSSPAASILETKILINSVILETDKNARFMTLDLKDFFLASPMDTPEYMKLLYKHIPQDIQDCYNLDAKVAKDGYIYVKIKKGMYGLKQAAVLAFN